MFFFTGYTTIFTLSLILTAAVLVSTSEAALLKHQRSIFIDNAWTGSSPRFSLLTENDKQYVGYYDADRRMTVASKLLDSEEWTYQKLDDLIGWDSHNYISMALDSGGHLHVSGNMHGSPLRYYRTTRPGDVTSLTGIHRMIGENEGHVTYPRFFTDSKGKLFYTYRIGRSGDGSNYVNTYNPSDSTWSRCGDKPFMDGEGKMNAYSFNPVPDHSGNYHVAWCWRDTPDVVTNHDVSYARSIGSLDNWQKSDGTLIELPLNIRNTDIVDTVPTNAGLMNSVILSLDSKDRPMVSYVKYDTEGKTQIFTMRLEGSDWKQYITTDWDCRWEFSGTGSIGFKILFEGPVHSGRPNVLCQVFTNLFIAPYAQIRFLDEETLQPISQPSRLYPAELDDIHEDEQDEWQMNWVGFDMEELQETGHVWMLRWKSMRPNRDRPRETTPPPSRLEIMKFVIDSNP